MPEAKPTQDTFESTLGSLVHDVARSLTAAFDVHLKPLDLTRSQWRAIICVAWSPGISQAGLADRLSVGRMSVTVVVDKATSAISSEATRYLSRCRFVTPSSPGGRLHLSRLSNLLAYGPSALTSKS